MIYAKRRIDLKKSKVALAGEDDQKAAQARVPDENLKEGDYHLADIGHDLGSCGCGRNRRFIKVS